MNRKGFTLVELLATLAVLAIVVGIATVSISAVMKDTKDKTEEAFIATLEDAIDIYLSGNEKKSLTYNGNCASTGYKYATITMKNIINSPYQPIAEGALVNPANSKNCNASENISIRIIRNNNYVYYYKIDKNDLGCLTTDGVITNLPEDITC